MKAEISFDRPRPPQPDDMGDPVTAQHPGRRSRVVLIEEGIPPAIENVLTVVHRAVEEAKTLVGPVD